VGSRSETVSTVIGPGGVPIIVAGPHTAPLRGLGGMFLMHPETVHVPVFVLVATALTALPLAARRIYPIGVCLTIAAAILVVHRYSVPPVALGPPSTPPTARSRTP